jgi:hypothetical protein
LDRSVARAILALTLLLASPAFAQDAELSIEERIEELRERAVRVQRQAGADAADPALEHARRALRVAFRHHRAGQTAASERALAIADAALVLADRLAARARARSAAEEAQRSEVAARERSEAAREALAHALSERARALREAAGDGG